MLASSGHLDTASLRQHVRLLGDTLGEVIQASAGQSVFDRIEAIRQSSKNANDVAALADLFDD